jgi:phage-related protein
MKPVLKVRFYATASGSEPVRKWLRELKDEDRKIIGEDIFDVQCDWPVGLPLVRPLGVGLWEIRSKLDNRISRVIFYIDKGHLILLHGFIKKTEKTPEDDLNLAKRRAKDLL